MPCTSGGGAEAVSCAYVKVVCWLAEIFGDYVSGIQ